MEALKDWSDYPIGTKAPAIMGGYWIKRVNGWQWNETGGTFPRPGADNSGTVILPLNK